MRLFFTLLAFVILTVQTYSQVTLGNNMDATAPLITEASTQVYTLRIFQRYCRIIPALQQHIQSVHLLQVIR